MINLQFHCTGCVCLDVHGLILEPSMCFSLNILMRGSKHSKIINFVRTDEDIWKGLRWVDTGQLGNDG